MADGRNSSLAGPGHNSLDRQKLKALVDRYENVDKEVDELKDAQKDLMEEVKSAGFDTKAFKAAIRVRKADAEKQRKMAEDREKSDLYLQALGNGGIFG